MNEKQIKIVKATTRLRVLRFRDGWKQLEQQVEASMESVVLKGYVGSLV